MTSLHRRAFRFVAVVLAVALGAAARADQLRLQLEPGFSSTHTSTRTQEGASSTLDANDVLQRYRLTLDQTLMPLVRLSGTGTYDWTLGYRTVNGTSSDLDERLWAGNLRLDAGGPTLRGGAAYSRSQSSSELRTAGVTVAAPTLVHDVWDTFAAWRPEGLPAVDARFSLSRSFDTARQVADVQEKSTLLNATYSPTDPLELAYTLRWLDTENRVRGFETNRIAQSARATYANTFADRVSVYARDNLQANRDETTVTGAAGVLETQQSPVAGLSAIEVFPATPERITLTQNRELIDGNTTASAGIDLGFGRRPADDRFRDIGAQLPSVLPDGIDEIRVWVDRALPQQVAQAISWTPYQSEDGETWTPLPLAGAVRFDEFQPRFEIPVSRTRARFVKVIARPLPLLVTTDERFAQILVTELQVFSIISAAEARGVRTGVRNELNTSATVRLLRSPDLAFDTAMTWVQADQPSTPVYDVSNGISLSHRLRPTLGLTARLSRADTNRAGGHAAETRYTTSLAARPLQTLTGTLSLSGGLSEAAGISTWLQSIFASANAELYRGISALANGSYSVQFPSIGPRVDAATVLSGLSLTPNRYVVVTGSAALTDTRRAGAERDRSTRVEGTVTLTPVPALYLSGGLARLTGVRTTTLANVNVSAAPFAGGALVLTFAFQESLDTATDYLTRTWGPNMRWNIRRGTYLNLSYTDSDVSSPATQSSGRVLFGTLLVTLG